MTASTSSSSASWPRAVRRGPGRCGRSGGSPEEVGHTPSTAEYRQVSERLQAAGEDVEPFTRVYAHYVSWPRAREALSLPDSSPVTAIEARFRHRRIGKPWRYSEQVLRETLMRCAEFYGRPPSIAEFNWWRRREFSLPEARGEEGEVQLPNCGAYKRRYGGWEQTLLHCGFTPQEVDRRHDQRIEFKLPRLTTRPRGSAGGRAGRPGRRAAVDRRAGPAGRDLLPAAAAAHAVHPHCAAGARWRRPATHEDRGQAADAAPLAHRAAAAARH